MQIKDSGKRETFASGSVRDTQDGKGRFDLLPPRAIKRLAQHFQNGAAKYGDRNWEKGQPLSRYIDSALRHIFSVLEGKTDEPHLDAAIWNLTCAAETQSRIEEGILPSELADFPFVTRNECKEKNQETADPRLEFESVKQWLEANRGKSLSYTEGVSSICSAVGASWIAAESVFDLLDESGKISATHFDNRDYLMYLVL